jgi:hypothetical protein
MSLELHSWALRQPIRDHVAKLVLIALVDHEFHEAAGESVPSVALLADLSSCSESAVRKKLRWLESEGWIKRHTRYALDGGQLANAYEIIKRGAAK